MYSFVNRFSILFFSYLPVAMARAWLPWREDDFAGAEREFHASAEFCGETPHWQLHAAHVLFMRGDKYKEAAAFYEPVVRQNYDDVNIFTLQTFTDFLLIEMFCRFYQYLRLFWRIYVLHTL